MHRVVKTLNKCFDASAAGPGDDLSKLPFLQRMRARPELYEMILQKEVGAYMERQKAALST